MYIEKWFNGYGIIQIKLKLTMKKMSDNDLKEYLSKITDENLYSYNVYQIEGEGRNLF